MGEERPSLTSSPQDKARFNNEKALAAATAHKQALEQQVRDKEDIAGRMRALLEAAAEQKVRPRQVVGCHKGRLAHSAGPCAQATLEASLASYKESVDALQRKLEGSVDEITRGNEVIARLHRERKAERQKLKLKGQVVLQQERSLEEKGRLLEEARREVRYRAAAAACRCCGVLTGHVAFPVGCRRGSWSAVWLRWPTSATLPAARRRRRRGSCRRAPSC